jgi:hypothetical protein
MHGATADNRAPTGTCTQFRQSHPDGHDAILSLTAQISPGRYISRRLAFDIPQSAEQSVKCNCVNQLFRDPLATKRD